MANNLILISALGGVFAVLAGVAHVSVKTGPSSGHAVTALRVAQQEVAALRRQALPAEIFSKIEELLSSAFQALEEKRYDSAVDLAGQAIRSARAATQDASPEQSQ